MFIASSICYCIIMLYGFSNYIILELTPSILLWVLAEQVMLGEFEHIGNLSLQEIL